LCELDVAINIREYFEPVGTTVTTFGSDRRVKERTDYQGRSTIAQQVIFLSLSYQLKSLPQNETP
jgi:hypothetical protein